MLTMNRDRVFPIVVILTALAIRLVFGLIMFQGVNIAEVDQWDDDWAYVGYSRSVLNMDFVNNPEKIEYDWPDLPRDGSSGVAPGYPMILAVCLAGTDNYQNIVFLNSIIGALTALVIFSIVKKNTGNQIIALGAGLWYSVYMLDLRMSFHALKEPVVSLLIMLIVMVISYNCSRRWLQSLLVSLIVAALIHTDERYVVAIPFLAVALLLIHGKVAIKWIAIGVITIALLSLPWFVRNYRYYNKPVVITERASGFIDKILGHKADDTPSIYFGMDLLETQLDSIRTGKQVMSIHERAQHSISNALEKGLRPRNFNTFEKVYYNTINLWRAWSLKPYLYATGYATEGPWSLSHNLVSVLQFGLLQPFFFVGVIRGLWRKNRMVVIVSSIVLANWITHAVLTFGIPRYRLPIDPLIICVSFYFIASMWKNIKCSYRKQAIDDKSTAFS